MSINANANGGFAGMDAHKKALIGENSEMESGYVSNWSISHSHVTASTSGLSSSANFRSSSSFKRSVDLETISENNEPKGKFFIKYGYAFQLLKNAKDSVNINSNNNSFIRFTRNANDSKHPNS